MRKKQCPDKVLTRREILKYGLYGSSAAVLPISFGLNGCGKQQTAEKPNIILISIDTLRADHLGCYGYERPTSPTIDTLASQGLLFEDVTSTSPWTLPSHGSLLTGLYPSHHTLKSFYTCLPSDVVTLAEILKSRDFSTGAIVNSFYLSQRYGFARGFDDFTYIKEIAHLRTPSEVGDQAIKWLSVSRGKPFFLFLHYMDVHSDYASLPVYEKLFDRRYQGIADGSTGQLMDFRFGRIKFSQADAERLIDLYDAGIRQMDDQIARLFGFLESRKLLSNSIVIITSDHGEEFLEHGGVLHSRTQYQELIHVPLIFCGPGIPESERIKHMVSNVDVMPTLLSMLDIPGPSSTDGFDLCNLWQRPNSKLPRRYLFAEASEHSFIPLGDNVRHDIKRSIRYPRYKLHYDRLTKETQLYDLQYDPGEKTDVVSEHTSLADSMFSDLENFMTTGRSGPLLPPLTPDETQHLKSLGYL